MTKRLLLTRYRLVVGIFYSYADLALAAGYCVTTKGIVQDAYGREHNPHYVVDWTGKERSAFHSPREVLSDFARNHWPNKDGLTIYRLAE